MSVLSIPALLSQINSEINTNGAEEITGALLNKNLIDSVDTLNALKQDTLVSGTNIKTVGGVNLLGSGDVAVSGSILQREETGLNYTLAATDIDTIIRRNNASANTVTIPRSATTPLPLLKPIYVLWDGVGQGSFLKGHVDVTFKSIGTKQELRNSMTMLIQITTDVWIIDGNLIYGS